MPKKKTQPKGFDEIELDEEEQFIEDHYEEFVPIPNMEARIAELIEAARAHRKKPVTIRISQGDLEIIRTKAAKAGVPYQTYINMLIHKDVTDNV